MRIDRLVPITRLDSGEHADNEGVARFADAMRAKLRVKHGEGRFGWNRLPSSGSGCTIEDLERQLQSYIGRGDVVDIANYCMMIWNRRNRRGLE